MNEQINNIWINNSVYLLTANFSAQVICKGLKCSGDHRAHQQTGEHVTMLVLSGTFLKSMFY